MDEVKTCSTCRVEQSVTNFYKASTRSDGYCNRCKDCNREYETEYRKTERYKEKHRRIQSRFREKNLEREKIYRLARTVPLSPSCNRCEVTDKRLVRHHPDYSEPKLIVTLCERCHRAVHKELQNV